MTKKLQDIAGGEKSGWREAAIKRRETRAIICEEYTQQLEYSKKLLFMMYLKRDHDISDIAELMEEVRVFLMSDKQETI